MPTLKELFPRFALELEALVRVRPTGVTLTSAPRAVYALGVCCLLFTAGCPQPRSRGERAQPSSASSTPLNTAEAPSAVSSASAAPAVSAPAVPALAAAGPPFDVSPAVQDKDVIADGTYHHHIYEPGALVGPERRFVKAFDCTGAQHADVVGACVRFAGCDGKPASDAATPNLVATLSCRGPKLELLLLREGDTLTFRAADRTHPMAGRPMTRFELPPSATLKVGPLAHKYVSVNVDL
jgi:hypothetical protein